MSVHGFFSHSNNENEGLTVFRTRGERVECAPAAPTSVFVGLRLPLASGEKRVPHDERQQAILYGMLQRRATGYRWWELQLNLYLRDLEGEHNDCSS